MSNWADDRDRRRWPARYFDGRTSAPRPVAVTLRDSGLAIDPDDGGARIWWPYTELRVTQGTLTGEPVRLERGADPPELLVSGDRGLLEALRESAPERVHVLGTPSRDRARLRVTLGAIALLAGLTALVWSKGVPLAAGWAAERVPLAWEEQLGGSAVELFAPARRRCEDPALAAAVADMTTRLTGGTTGPVPVRVLVSDMSMVNAFAFPGGTVVLCHGLIKSAKTPDEVAGVLAHEIAHVRRRHVTRGLLEQGTFGLLLSALSGDLAGGAAWWTGTASTLGGLAYSREREAEADADALLMLAAAGYDPEGLASFFRTLEKGHGDDPGMFKYLSSHPVTKDRIARAESGARTVRRAPAPAPRTGAPAWADLKIRCRPAQPPQTGETRTAPR